VRRKILFVFAVLLLAAFGSALKYYISVREVPAGSELALPKLRDQDEYVLARIENPGIFTGKIARLSNLPPDFAGEIGVRPVILDGMAALLERYRDILSPVGSLLGVADDMSVLRVSSDGGGLYASLISDAGEFGRWLADGDGSSFSPSRWETAYAEKGDEAWTLTVDVPGERAPLTLYVLNKRESGPDFVMISDSEDGVGRMLEARKRAGARIEVRRYNAGPDYVQVRARLPLRGSGGTTTGTTEVAWVEDSASAHMQIYSSAYSSMTDRSVPRSGLEGDLPLMGSGDLAMVAAVDIPFLCFSVFPTEDDPVGVLLSMPSADLPPAQAQDLASILAQGRVSLVLVVDGAKSEPNTAYIMIESKASEPMDRLYALASLLPGTQTEIPGWGAAYSSSMMGGLNMVAARRGDAVLFGIGRAEDYLQSPTIPPDIGDFADPHDLVNFVARKSLLEVGESSLGKMARSQMSRMGIGMPLSGEFGLESIDAVQFRIMTPEYSNLGIYWDR
jgi:hypothetical protein